MYQRINEISWKKFGDELIQSGKDKQVLDKHIEFLQSCRNGNDAFLKYLQDNLLSDINNIIEGKNVVFEHKFTEAEFRFPPLDTQELIWDTFSKIDKKYLCYCGFWGNIIFNMIKNNSIESHYLASNLNGVNETGIYMIDNAINSNDGEIIDKCIRRILRSMCSPSPRGSRIVFYDFYIGKAYWRWNWAYQVSDNIKKDITPEHILNTLDEKGYTVFAEKMSSGKSYISQINLFSGLLLFLKKNISNITVKEIGKIIDKLSYLSSWKAIELQTPESNQKEVEIISNSLS
jgi:hypothetical protein